MARAGRKQLAVQIKEESFTRLEEIKQETGLSNAKLIEMLIENYSGTNINTNTNTGITEETIRKILKEELSCINTNTNINTDTPKAKKPTKKKPEPVLVPDEEEPLPDKPFYTLRKPVYEGKPETRHTRKTNLMVEWWLEEGDSQYYDEHQSIIPFRYKKADGTDYTPNEAEIKLLEEAYEKPVKIEK